MSNSVTGQIFYIGQAEQVTPSFTKRAFIVVDNSNAQYPQHIPMEVTQNNIGLLDQFQVNQVVTVDYNMRGNLASTPDPKTGAPRAFLTLQAWRISAAAGTQPTQQQPQQQGFPQQQPAQMPWQQQNQAPAQQPPMQNQQAPAQQQGFNNPPPNVQQQQPQQGYPAPGTNNNSPI